jgi:hypothetical protein
VHDTGQEPLDAADEVGPAKRSLQVAGWVWGVSLALILVAVYSDTLKVFASFLLIPLLCLGVPFASAVGIVYGLKGMRTVDRKSAIQGIILNAASVVALVVALKYPWS